MGIYNEVLKRSQAFEKSKSSVPDSGGPAGDSEPVSTLPRAAPSAAGSFASAPSGAKPDVDPSAGASACTPLALDDVSGNISKTGMIPAAVAVSAASSASLLPSPVPTKPSTVSPWRTVPSTPVSSNPLSCYAPLSYSSILSPSISRHKEFSLATCFEAKAAADSKDCPHVDTISVSETALAKHLLGDVEDEELELESTCSLAFLGEDDDVVDFPDRVNGPLPTSIESAADDSSWSTFTPKSLPTSFPFLSPRADATSGWPVLTVGADISKAHTASPSISPDPALQASAKAVIRVGAKLLEWIKLLFLLFTLLLSLLLLLLLFIVCFTLFLVIMEACDIILCMGTYLLISFFSFFTFSLYFPLFLAISYIYIYSFCGAWTT